MGMIFKDGDTILFQGDSVTDCGRSPDGCADLGNGYANMIAAITAAVRSRTNLVFINKGVSGNRTTDLLKRWETDCIDINPDWLSVLIGINDCWRRYDKNDPMSTAAFEENYRAILTITKQRTHAKLILCEPFVLPYPEDRLEWREDLDPKIHAVRKLAREFGALYIPFDGLFAQACTDKPPEFWAADGVHPSQAGHALMAKAWMNATGITNL